jgi:tRNA pseudouridine55 synthase
MDGLILVDKPQKFTSHDIVLELRRLLQIKKIGHFGTLDPLATGVLILAVGKATRLFPFFSKEKKSYAGQIRLGFATETYDSFGQPTSAETQKLPDESEICEAMKKLEGEVLQTPPLYSAKKYRGQPSYKLARGKKEVLLKPVKVFIHSFALQKYYSPCIEFAVQCSSGTFIRSLAHDLGQNLGCGAHLTELKRITSGHFKLSDCLTLDKIKGLTQQGRFEEFLIPLESLLPQFPKIILKETGALRARNGHCIFPEDIQKVLLAERSLPLASQEEKKIFRLFSLEGKLLGLARKEPDQKGLLPFLVLS